MASDPFFRKEEAVVENLGVNVLHLVFFNETGQFLGDAGWIELDWTRCF